MRWFVGAYTDDDGSATGIGVVRTGDRGGSLSAEAEAVSVSGSPSWLAWHPTLDVVYAARESAGDVQVYRRGDEARLEPLGRPVEAGGSVCHVAVEPGGNWLLASCWGDGRLVRMPLDARGVPSGAVVAPAAVDPYAEPVYAGDDVAGEAVADARAEAGARPSRTHQAVFVPGGQVVTIDMGLDHLRVWEVREGRLRGRQSIVLPRGSGPRHAVWHPSGHLLVVTELSLELFVIARGADGAWRVVGGRPLSPAGEPGRDFAAEVALSADGAFVYAGVRGSDTIATLRVTGDGSEVSPVALAESGVVWPRHHVVVEDALLVAGQRSDDIAMIPVDGRTGVPGRVRARATAASPSHLLLVR